MKKKSATQVEEVDALYEQALEIVLKTRKPSISLVQRHLRIGYDRAVRLIAQMEKDGWVSPIEPNGNRVVTAKGVERALSIPQVEDRSATQVEEVDALYEQALEIVLKTRRPSPYLVQRYLRIGFARAAIILERMEKDGWVSPMAPNGTREFTAKGFERALSTPQFEGESSANSNDINSESIQKRNPRGGWFLVLGVGMLIIWNILKR